MHNLSSLYEAFAPAEARSLTERLEIHYTPEHGSWLNMAEPEQSIMERQCLGRRVSNKAAMRQVTTAWQERSSEFDACVVGSSLPIDGRIKIK